MKKIEFYDIHYSFFISICLHISIVCIFSLSYFLEKTTIKNKVQIFHAQLNISNKKTPTIDFKKENDLSIPMKFKETPLVPESNATISEDVKFKKQEVLDHQDKRSKNEKPDNSYYYGPSEVEEQIIPIKVNKPVYPYELQKKKISGYVRMKLFINELGKIDEIKIISSEPQGVFDKIARNAFMTGKYDPPIKNGQKVKGWIQVLMGFEAGEIVDNKQSVNVNVESGNFDFTNNGNFNNF